MMCSPYLTGSLAIMLVIVSFQYWTVSTENTDLGKRIFELQNQLKTGSKHILSLESDIKDLQKTNNKLEHSKNEEKKLKEEAESKYKDAVDEKEKLDKKLTEMSLQADEDEEKKKRLAEEKERQEETEDNLRDELDSVKGNLTVCTAELASERADKLLAPPAGASHVPPRHLGNNNLGPGQLPDVNPEAVSVIKKETQGMRFHQDKSGHWLPIIVQGDPQRPRAQPSLSVMDIKPGHLSANKDTLLGAGLAIVEPRHNDKPGGISSSSKPPAQDTDELNLPGDNLDNAEDDSQIAQHENGPEGKEEIQDDDQNPDGQIDERVDLDKQIYLDDKNHAEGDIKDETLTGERDDENTDDFGTGNEDVGEEKLENLKESLKKEDESPMTR